MNNQQYSLNDYRLNQVEVRLKLSECRSYYSEEPITDADSAVRFMSEILLDLEREWVCILSLDTKLKPICFNVVSIGSADRALVPIQNIMKAGLLSGASNLILLHTHPSGDPTPSPEDLALTEKVILAGKLMELPLVDHVVSGCGTRQTFSIRSHFPELFDSPEEEKNLEEKLLGTKKKSRGMER